MKYHKKKKNPIQDTGLGYYRVFYINEKAEGHYFTVFPEDAEIFKAGHNATGDIRANGSIEPCITVNGKKIRYANYIMNTNKKQKNV